MNIRDDTGIMATSWSKSYLEQALSDWDIFKLLLDCSNQCIPGYEAELCHCLHYLQMSIEKLGKAFLLEGGQMSAEEAKKTHASFVKYLELSGRNHTLARLLGQSPNKLERYVRSISDFARSVEMLAPALAGNAPNAEYPWQDKRTKDFHVPCQYAFPEVSKKMKGSEAGFYKFVNLLFDHYDELV